MKAFSTPTPLLSHTWVPYGDVHMVIDGEDRVWVAYETDGVKRT